MISEYQGPNQAEKLATSEKIIHKKTPTSDIFSVYLIMSLLYSKVHMGATFLQSQ